MVKSAYILSLLFFFLLGAQNEIVNAITFFHVGVILDITSEIGKTAESSISMALSDFYNLPNHANYTTRLVLHSMDSKNDVVVSASSALYLMKDVEVQAIIGPQQSTQASFVIDLGEKAQVPIVSFSATSPSLSPLESPYFIRTAINDSAQVKAITAIIQALEWKEVVLIYEDTGYGKGVIPYFIDAFQEVGVRVAYKSAIPLDANDDQIMKELKKLTTMQTRVFIVHMSSTIGSRLFINADKAGMMSKGYAWIVTDGLSSLLASMDSNTIDSMEGVLGVRPYIPKSKELEEFKVRWKRSFISDPSLYGIWAYDTVWALAMAVERVGTLDHPQFLSSNTADNLTDLSSLGYSPIGPTLFHTILSTRFKGLSGDFHLVNGELNSTAFQIFNVIGVGERVIGYWTPTVGISRHLNTTHKSNLKAILWPGDSITKPKGWAIIPVNGEKSLQILVPVKEGFNQFVNVERDNLTNEVINITGICIDVFGNVTSRLPFGLPYEFLFYPLDGSVLNSYEELIDQIYLKNYDAAVGDVSILANRSNYADFTMPYSESGVIMVVPVQNNLMKEFWMFLKPLSPSLWLGTIAGFFGIGILVWILERLNSDFGPTHRERFEKSLWFSSLTLVFAQREKIENNLTRFVLITWMFYVLILTQSYTASLSSMLTARQLQPTITDINEIKSNGYYVGYQDGSFVKQFLIDHLNFDKSKLKNYTPEDYDEALTNGTDNGGVAAIFDELPYIQAFLNTYCNKYTTVGATYSSEGFGFVFPKGSPLVSYISMAILNLTDDGTLETIKQGWLENQTNCNNVDTSSTSAQLTLASFGGLFFILGAVSGLALFIHLILFLYGRCCNEQITTTPAQSRMIPLRVVHPGTAEHLPRAGAEHREEEVPEIGAMEHQQIGAGNREEEVPEIGIMEHQRIGAGHREEVDAVEEASIVEGGL